MLSPDEMAKRHRLLQLDRCPECGSKDHVTDRNSGEIVCGRCGLVIRDLMFDQGPEWRDFTQQEREDRSRVGTPIILSVHDKGLSTVIDRVNRDAFGRELSASTRLQMLRLRKWHIRTRVYSSVDRNLAQAMTELGRLTDKIRIPPSVKEQAALTYRKALDKGLVRGRSILAFVGASLYAACRFTQTPRTLKEVAEASLVKKKDVARCYRLLLRELEIKMPTTNPIECVPKIGSKIGINEKTQQTAINILRKAEEKKAITGKNPMGIAAAAIYIATSLNGESITQGEIAEVAGVTEVTVRTRYKGLVKSLGLNLKKRVIKIAYMNS